MNIKIKRKHVFQNRVGKQGIVKRVKHVECIIYIYIYIYKGKTYPPFGPIFGVQSPNKMVLEGNVLVVNLPQQTRQIILIFPVSVRRNMHLTYNIYTTQFAILVSL